MNCRKASGLMQNYIEDKLKANDKALLEQHTAGCRRCRDELELIKRLEGERLRQFHVKAPEGFTDNVMSMLYRLPPERRPHPAAVPDNRWKLVYRRLGYSLILTAGIIMFSLLGPVTGFHPDAISVKVQSGVESSGSGYTSIFTNLNTGIMGIFKDLGNQETDNEGGTGNGM